MSAPLHVILATRNAGKVREFERLFDPLISVEALGAEVSMPQETGSTFAENARLKAESISIALGGAVAVVADDSGLEVDVLDGRPGVFSARYAGEGAGDSENVSRLLKELRDIEDRTARFVCCLCLALPPRSVAGLESRLIEVRGVLEGRIVAEPRGEDGFGYDPVFEPEGWIRTLAEASPAEKDSVSHRGVASQELLRLLGESGLVRCEGA